MKKKYLKQILIMLAYLGKFDAEIKKMMEETKI